MLYRVDFLVAYRENGDDGVLQEGKWYHHMCIIQAADRESVVSVFDDTIAKQIFKLSYHKNEHIESFDMFIHPVLHVYALEPGEDTGAPCGRVHYHPYANRGEVVFQTMYSDGSCFINHWYLVPPAEQVIATAPQNSELFASLQQFYYHADNLNYKGDRQNIRTGRRRTLLGGEEMDTRQVDEWGKNVRKLAEFDK